MLRLTIDNDDPIYVTLPCGTVATIVVTGRRGRQTEIGLTFPDDHRIHRAAVASPETTEAARKPPRNMMPHR